VPGCANATVSTPRFGTVVITVASPAGAPQADLPVYVFNGSTYTGFSGRTDSTGQVSLTLPEGNYRFRADKNNVQYWSNPENHCAVPDCTVASVSVPVFGPVTVSVTDSMAAPQADLPVYVFDGNTYTGFNGRTDSAGQVSLTLPEGNYRFRVDKNNVQYWSNPENHCAVPACTSAGVSVQQFAPVVVTVTNTGRAPEGGLPVYVFDGVAYTGFNGITGQDGALAMTLPEGNYRFRADKNNLQYWSAAENHCAVPGCASSAVTVPVFGQVTVTVTDTASVPQTDLPVYVFDGSVYTGFNGRTDASGQVSLTLPEGNYRFRTDKNS